MHTSEAWAKSPSMTCSQKIAEQVFLINIYQVNLDLLVSLKSIMRSSASYIEQSFVNVSKPTGVRGCMHCEICA